MKTNQLTYLALVLAVLTTAASVFAVDTPVRSVTDAPHESNRSEKKFGTYLSILGDPSPTLVGINAAYNVSDLIRLNAGLGRVSVSAEGFGVDQSASLTTIGVGAKAMMPGWNFTPVVGLDVAYAIYSGNMGLEVNGLEKTGINPYATLGFDWQSKGGFNIGGGYSISFVGADAAPHLNIGWFF